MRTKIPRNLALSADMLPDRTESLGEAVTSVLREAIFTGKLKPGERLVEESLAEQLGTSRGPIRDAMRQLQQEGLVTVLPRRGAVVSTPSVDEARQAYGLRIVLEEYAASLAVEHLDDEDLGQLGKRITQMQAAADSDDLHTLLSHDEAFHDIVWYASRHQKLLQMRAQIAPQIHAYTVAAGHLYPDLHVLADSHVPVLEALISRDPERVKAAIRDHVALGARLWIEILSQLAEPDEAGYDGNGGQGQ